VNKVQDIVQAHGKEMIGWDEISQANLKANSVAQFWSNEVFANAAASKGAKIIMSPAKRIYLDMKYDSTTKLGTHWAAYIEVDAAFTWNPATYAKGITKDRILGIESALWTETITSMDDIEYMVFPGCLDTLKSGGRRMPEEIGMNSRFGWEFMESALRHWISTTISQVGYRGLKDLKWQESKLNGGKVAGIRFVRIY